VVGSGIASADISGTPAAAPSAPSNLDITSGNKYLLVAFNAGSNGGAAITDYEYSTDNGSTWVSAGTTSSPISISVTSSSGALLSNGTTYTVKVRAVNIIGSGTASSGASSAPCTNPGTPSAVVASYGSGSISIEFEEGSNGGSDITGYEYSTDGGATWRMRDVGTTMTSSPITITKLSSDGLTAITNGTSYDVAIRAVNKAGAGRESATFTVIPAGVPDVPTITAVNSSNGGLSVEFTAGNSGGRSVIRNEYSIDGGSTWVIAPTLNSPIIISGLTNGTAYALQVRQVNEVGNGPSSITVEGTPYTTPGSPTIDEISAGNATISLFFTDGATNGTQITSYEYSTDDGATWRTRRTGTIESPLTITMLSSDGTTALQNGTAYSVKIRAVNAAGSGTESESVRIAPYTVPSAPVISAVEMRNSHALLTYSVASTGGAAITGYEYSLNGGITWLNASSTANPLRISGLVNGNSYSLILRADNRAGYSDSSSTVSLAPVGPPDAPRINTLTPGDETLEVAFTDGSTSGSPITGYEYTIDGGTTWVTATGATSSPFTISGLNNGTIYTVQVRAVNAQGSGTASDPVISKPYTVPGAPIITDIVVSGNEATVEYTTPATDGGQAITSYEYSIDNGDSWVSTNSSTVMSVQITNLVEGEEYEIAVRAVNSAGAGDAATVSTQSVVEDNSQPVVVDVPKSKTEPVEVPVVEVPVAPAPVPAPSKKPTASTPPPVSNTPEFLEESRGVKTAPGKAVVIINDQVSEVVIEVTDGVGAIYVDSDTILNITLRTPSGEVFSVDEGTVLHGVRGGVLEINGEGLAPNSEVGVWINSDPVFLGTAMTDENGRFTASFSLPEGLLEGEHTLTLGGTATNGVNIKTSLGLIITSEPQVTVDETQSNTSSGSNSLGMMTLFALVMVLLGFGGVLIGK
ncbi:MAG: fibronectin type III domain-containing protein, partial [Actinobacteria bacterium]|nr:fibronectin type III domain-containing protein [Actinomycetota bacterium]